MTIKVQFHRAEPGSYYTKALGYHIYLIKNRVDGGSYQWHTESRDGKFPVFKGATKAAVVSQVNSYLQGMVKR